jgi:hypothetical protein
VCVSHISHLVSLIQTIRQGINITSIMQVFIQRVPGWWSLLQWAAGWRLRRVARLGLIDTCSVPKGKCQNFIHQELRGRQPPGWSSLSQCAAGGRLRSLARLGHLDICSVPKGKSHNFINHELGTGRPRLIVTFTVSC